MFGVEVLPHQMGRVVSALRGRCNLTRGFFKKK